MTILFQYVVYFEILITLILLIDSMYSIYKKGIIISAVSCAYYTFIAFFILPNLIMLWHDELNIFTYGYQFIKDNMEVELIFTIFMSFAYAVLRKETLKSDKKKLLDIKKIKKIKIHFPIEWILIAFVGTIIPIFAACMSPQPELYFMEFAPFEKYSFSGVSNSALQYHQTIFNYILSFSMLCCIFLWFAIRYIRTNYNFRILIKTYLVIMGLLLTIFSSKRTLGILLFLIYLIIDFLYEKEKPWLESIFIIGGCIVYFIGYQVVVQKTVGGGASTFLEIYIIYFSRLLDFRFITYSLLHPEIVKILDYPCQSFIFDILFFIKRSIWESKPFPFGMYYTAAWLNIPVESVTYRYTVSWFGEALANLSWIGIPIGVWMYIKFLRFIDRLKHPFVSMYGIFVSFCFMVTHVQSNLVNLMILFLLYIFVEPKYSRARIEKSI